MWANLVLAVVFGFILIPLLSIWLFVTKTFTQTVENVSNSTRCTELIPAELSCGLVEETFLKPSKQEICDVQLPKSSSAQCLLEHNLPACAR